MKVGFVYAWHPSNARALEAELAYMRGKGVDVTGVDVKPLLQYYFGPYDLDFQYCLRNRQILDGLARLKEACKAFTHIVIYGTLQIHPDFIRTAWADKYVVYWSTDDPVSSVVHTLPWVGVANHVWCQTPIYLDNLPMPEWLRQMGAKQATYAPLGYFPDWMRGLSPEEILNRKRDIDISFVGSPSWRKHMLLAAKRKYGRKLRIYSRDWRPLQHFAYDALKGGVLHFVGPARDESEIYFRSRISINSNACSGPSTSRTFHIPICGAVQVCDFPEGLKKVFDLDRHVIPYEFVNFDSLSAALDPILSDEPRQRQIREAALLHTFERFRFGDLLTSRLAALS